MRRTRDVRVLTAALMVLWGGPQLWGTQYVPPSDLGVVCLDEATGRAEWEYFPERLGPCALATDGQSLYMVTDQYNARSLERRILELQAIDLATRQPVDAPKLPEAVHMAEERRWFAVLRTPTGDRIARSMNSRAVVILQGDSDSVRSVIPFPDVYERLDIQGSTVLLLSQALSWDPRRSVPQVVGIDVGTRKRIWTSPVGDLERPGLLGPGERNFYVAGKDTLRALDPRTGRTAWSVHVPAVGMESWVAEHGGHLYVVCRFGPAFNDAVYCLDAKTGTTLWRKTPGDSLFPSGLLFHDGKIYTQIEKAPLTQRWSNRNLPVGADGQPVRTAEEGRIIAFREAFSGKSTAEIELNLRAWYALGDRAAIRVLKAAGEAVSDSRLKEVVGKLVETYPAYRDYERLVSFLAEEVDRNEAARFEFRRILRDFRPPGWQERESLPAYQPLPGTQERLAEATPEQQRVIDKYKALRDRIATIPFPPPGRVALSDFYLSKCQRPSFEWLVQARQASASEADREEMTNHLFQQYPAQAADWALANERGLDWKEVRNWVAAAPKEWLCAHPDYMRRWLATDDPEMCYAIQSLLLRLPDEVALPTCVDIATKRAKKSQQERIELVAVILNRIGLSRQTQYAPLVEEFLGSRVTCTRPAILIAESDLKTPFTLTDVAVRVLRYMGVEPPPGRLTAEEASREARYREAVQVQQQVSTLSLQMSQACAQGRHGEAKQRAKQIVHACQSQPATCFDDFTLECAWETLEDWQKVSEIRAGKYAKYPELGEGSLVEALVNAKRYDDLERMAEKISNVESQILAAKTFCEAGRLEVAEQMLARRVHEDPGDWKACVLMAQVEWKRGNVGEADGWMERAIALVPTPAMEPLFQATVTYWIDRGRADRAAAWVKASAAQDIGYWWHLGLLDWAHEFPALRKTVDDIRRPYDQQGAGKKQGAVIGGGVGGFIALIAAGWWMKRRHDRCHPKSLE